MERKNAQHEDQFARVSFALDAAESVRSVDENGFLHVATSHLTKATVNPYYGREIPNGVEHGYLPDSIYYGFRDPEELEKSLETWEGLPIHALHHMDSADDPQRDTRVGAVGTDVTWNDPYIDAPLTIWDGGAIDAINDGSLRELSCAYRYEPDFTTGEYDGMRYDFIMRDIRGNHVALVEEGRAGPDVLVADQNTVKGADMENIIQQTDAVTEAPNLGVGVADAPADVEQQEVDLAQAIIDLHKIDPTTGQIVDISEDEAHAGELKAALGDIMGGMPPEKLARIANALKGLKFGPLPMPTAPEEIVAQTADVPVEGIAYIDESPTVLPQAAPAAEAPEQESGGEGTPSADAPIPPKQEEAPAAPAAEAPQEEKKEAAAPVPPQKDEVVEAPNLGVEAAPAPSGEAESSPEPIREAPAEEAPAEPVLPVRDQEFREAMDKCGLDSENPDVAKAFAEGVMYGERTQSEKEEAEHHAEADSSPDIGPEPAPELPPNPDACPRADACPKAAQDAKAAAPATSPIAAQDAKAIRESAIKEAKEHMRSLYRAVETVKPLVGNIDALAFDSADDVYAHALAQKGYDPKRSPRSAWRPMIEVMLSERNLATFETTIGQDSAIHPADGPDATVMSRINIS